MRALLAAALLAAPAPVVAPAFQDGFESPAVPSGFSRLSAGTQIGPWQVSAGDVDLSTTHLWTTAEGRQNLDLDGTTNGAVTRTVPTTPLLTYRITYALGGNYVGPPAVKTGELRVNNQPTQTLTFNTAGRSRDNMGYTRHTTYVLAKSRSLKIEFAGTTTPAGYGLLLDDVRVDSCVIILCPRAAAVSR
ncbi:DUF642 domain-containing protein [Actinoplanes sp. LDG1-06]|uniref:DUF642 domain-containing protein n=1 Tax=Paractinoplanes ovalisporus TaxID=2810368 RepID=A0ABS2AQW0_9ACTN|nr:DUF642 domain-containing protein [Actinoplanes ovalisporus]MBM2622245.1 DUF642 domain-containing protein [Actinoplanes ovalisporus]